MATIEDVAAKAGVSIATVSRVLNNPDSVRQIKRDKVMEAVKDLNYQPNVLGRNLRRTDTKMILVVCTEVINEAMSGIHDVASELGYDVILSYSGKNQEERTITDRELQPQPGDQAAEHLPGSLRHRQHGLSRNGTPPYEPDPAQQPAGRTRSELAPEHVAPRKTRICL